MHIQKSTIEILLLNTSCCLRFPPTESRAAFSELQYHIIIHLAQEVLSYVSTCTSGRSARPISFLFSRHCPFFSLCLTLAYGTTKLIPVKTILTIIPKTNHVTESGWFRGEPFSHNTCENRVLCVDWVWLTQSQKRGLLWKWMHEKTLYNWDCDRDGTSSEWCQELIPC